ncbi:MAG: hypothetical protein Q7S51_11180, partial [Gallionellaceae bacterium]|nr:hypothetical protein [Gallionellaceae bacterium]
MNGILSGEKRDLPLLSLTPLILLVVLSIWSGGVFAAVCTSDSSGNWNAKDTWGTAATGCVGAPGGIPDANDDVIISAGHTVSLNGGNRDSRSFTIAATGQLDDDNRRLTINNNGNVVINGTWNGSGTLRKDGIGTLSGVGNVVGNVRFELRNTTTVLAGTNLTFTDTTNSRISISNGIVVTNNGTVTVAQMTGGNAASTWTNAANSTLNISRDLLTTGILNASAAGNTVNYNGAAQTVKLPSVSAGTPTYHHLTLSGSGAKTLLAGTLTINGNLTVVGAGVTYNGTTNNPVINLKENFSNSGTFNSGTGVFTFNGTTAQSLTGATTFTNMTMNNATGLTINNNVTVSSVLNLTSGNITTGTNILIMTPNCNTAGAVVRGIGGGHVFGNLRKPVPTGTPITCTWEVGGTTNYAPVTNTFASVTTAGTLTVRTDDGDHTDTASGIGGSCSVNRYWTLTPATMVVSTYSPTFTFVNPGDLDSGVDPTSTNFIVSKKNAGTWILPTMGTRTATSTQATGITNAQGFGEFVLGYTAATCFNHFAISHSGSAVNCQAEDITVAVHDVTHAIATSYTGTITLSTSTGKGDWSVVTGSGTLVNGTADDGAATYTFVAADNGDVVLGLKDTVAETVNINITNGTITEASGTATAAEDAILVFAASGFRITDGGAPPAAASIAPQTAGVTSVTYGLQAIRTDTSTGACVGAFASGTDVTVDLASQCNNPITCIVGQNVAITNNAVTANIASNPNSGVVSYTARSLRFGANSQALFTLSYPDAGSISLHARYNIPLGSGGPSSTNMMGS